MDEEFSFKSQESKATDEPKNYGLDSHIHVELGNRDRTMKFISSQGLRAKLKEKSP